MNPDTIANDVVARQETNNMVIARDIEPKSMWEHHILPCFGPRRVGCIPSGKVFGLSRSDRVLDTQARVLQI